MTVILGAMEGEISEVSALLANREVHLFRHYRMHSGEICGHPVLISRSGVGKSYSAMVCQHLIDTYSPVRVIFTGLAGAIAPRIAIGDTLVARDCMQHDLDATAVGFQRGEFPFENVRELPCDAELVSAASSFVPQEGTLHLGRVLTGDQFLDSERLSAAPWLRSELHGDAVEMEGASVGAVCRYNEVPFLLVRTISDKADTNARVDFERFLPRASRNSAAFVQHVMEQL